MLLWFALPQSQCFTLIFHVFRQCPVLNWRPESHSSCRAVLAANSEIEVSKTFSEEDAGLKTRPTSCLECSASPESEGVSVPVCFQL